MSRDEVWTMLPPGEVPEPDPLLDWTKRRTVQCLCGRFAKWAGDRHYYDGTWDQYEYTVLCSRCGEVTVKCV